MKRSMLLLSCSLLVVACGGSATNEAPSSTAGAAIAIASARAGASSPTPAATGTATPTATPRPAVLPGEPWLAFQGDNGGGTYGVRLVRPDGSGVFFPTDTATGSEQLHPDWSPDGARLVFSTMGTTARDLWITDADGGNPDHIVICDTCSQADEPAWSPDGTQIAFHRQTLDGDATVSTLEVLDLATRATRVVLTAAPGHAFYAPRWSPDGGRIVAENVGDGGGQLVVVDLGATKPKAVAITKAGYWPANPDWSPDGERIVFFVPVDPANFDAESDLWTIRPDGTGLTQLTHLADDHGLAIHPDWTPDGSRITFVTGTVGSSDPLVMATVAADGSDLRPATTNGFMAGLHPRLRPTP